MFKRILAAVAAALLIQMPVSAYNVVDLPHSMTFSDALGIFDPNEISSATMCDLDGNNYINLSREEIMDFYYASSNMTVWRKTNPTPFRGECINFTTTSGSRISYFFNSGIQIGTYGVDNYICYMPAKEDAIKLSYMQSKYHDRTENKYGGTYLNVCTAKDFLKLPKDEWAISQIKVAAAKNLVPYELTSKYDQPITREDMCKLLGNLIAIGGNYASLDAYMKATGTVYLKDNFADAVARDASIDQLYALNIVNGRTANRFEPDGAVSRQEMAAFLTRTAEQYMYVGSNHKTNAADKSKIAQWATFYVNWVLDKGIMSLDSSNRFNPNDSITVQQAITAVSRLYDHITYWES